MARVGKKRKEKPMALSIEALVLSMEKHTTSIW